MLAYWCDRIIKEELKQRIFLKKISLLLEITILCVKGTKASACALHLH